MPLSVTHPFLLLVLLVLLAASSLLLFFQPPVQVVIPAISFLPSRPYSLWHWSQWPKLLVFVAMILLILAVSGLTLHNSAATTSGSSIIFCLDASPSMEACDLTPEQWQQLEPLSLPPTRLHLAQQIIQAFLEQHHGTAIGLVAFARVPYLICPLMSNHAILKQRLQELTTNDFEDGTAIGDAILCALHAIPAKQRQNATIILLSDGADHGNSRETPEQTAKRCQAFGIPIVTIGIGSAHGGHLRKTTQDEWQWEFVAEEIDEQQLQQIATISGGNYLTTKNTADIVRVNDLLRQSLTIETQKPTKSVDLTPPLLIIALSMLTLAASLESIAKPRFATASRL